MLKTYNLNKVKLDNQVEVVKVEVSETIKRRILDLGIVEGTKIRPVLRSPLGDPTAYEVRGCMISLREEDAKGIKIKL